MAGQVRHLAKLWKLNIEGATVEQISLILKDQFGMIPKRNTINYTKPYPVSMTWFHYHPSIDFKNSPSLAEQRGPIPLNMWADTCRN